MSKRMYGMCREHGINFFDCADSYQKGASERILGSCIAGERDSVVITTKAFNPYSSDPNDRGCSAKHLAKALHGSLKRLGTDYVDLFFLHGFDPEVGEEEVLTTLQRFVNEGKILSFGVSNYAAYQVERLVWTARLKNLVPVSCIQPMYNVAKRMAEVELLPMARKEQLGVMTYSPLGGGLLTGRFLADAKETSVRLVENPRYAQRYGGPFYQEVAVKFRELADELGIAQATLAIAWVLANGHVTAPIIGAGNADQLAPSLEALSCHLDAQVLERIDAFSPPPPVATDRTEEQVSVSKG
jgi:aryl-alcohol dehydrogenase-like predicted oxidoreductase